MIKTRVFSFSNFRSSLPSISTKNEIPMQLYSLSKKRNFMHGFIRFLASEKVSLTESHGSLSKLFVFIRKTMKFRKRKPVALLKEEFHWVSSPEMKLEWLLKRTVLLCQSIAGRAILYRF